MTATRSATGAATPLLIRMPKIVAPVTIWAISERSSPREIMTTAIPQLRIASDAEFERMTPRFPSVANPSMDKENTTMSTSAVTATTRSSMFFLPTPCRDIREDSAS